jgi:hypothetical protein
MKILKLVPILLLSSAIHAAPLATATATVTNWADSNVGVPVHLTSHHHYHISSDKDGNVMFYFKMTLCVNDMKNCTVKNEYLGLVKGQHFDRDVDLEMIQTFNVRGSHPIWAFTEVTGGASALGQDQKYMWVK